MAASLCSPFLSLFDFVAIILTYWLVNFLTGCGLKSLGGGDSAS